MTAESDPPSPARPRRSAGRWLALLVVWLIGLCMWVFYFLLVGWIVLKLF